MLLLRGGTIVTMGEQGILPKGDLLVDKGKITRVAPKIPAEPDWQVVDVSGRTVVPGLIDAHSHVGLVCNEPRSDEANELTGPMQAELNSVDGISWEDPGFRDILMDGITTSCVIPGSGNVICGHGVVVKSAGRSRSQRILRNPAALKAAAGINPKAVYAAKSQAPMTRMSLYQMLRSYFRRVRIYLDAVEAAKGDPEKLPEYDEALEHGIPVLRKEIPLKVHVFQHDMMTILDLAKEFDFEVTMDHAPGASDFLEDLTDPHVRGIIYGPVLMGLAPGEPCKVDYESLRMLDDLGVPVAMMTDGPIVTGHMLICQVGEAVRMGMDPVRALAMVTSGAAGILGVSDRVGSLEPGKDADIAVFDGFPGRDVCASCCMTLIDGQIIYER